MSGQRYVVATTRTYVVSRTFHLLAAVGTLPARAHRSLRRRRETTMFRDALSLVPGINPSDWITYELRHSFVSIPS